jgi:hypothetical protein
MYDARDVAKYMTLADQSAFVSITVFDYLTKLSGSGFDIFGGGNVARGDSKKGMVKGRIDLFAQRSNMVR